MLSLFLSQSVPGGWPFLVALIILILIVTPVWAAFRRKKARKTSLEQGREGEEEVRLTLERSGQPGIFDNFMLVENGRSRQIDHIVVNSNGVFVIETKNLSGQIYGEEDWQEWTQVLSYGKVKNKFYNPVKQNLTHVRCVQKLLPKGVPVWSLIVFVQNNTAFIRSRGVVALSQLPAVLDQSTGYHHLCRADRRDLFTACKSAGQCEDQRRGTRSGSCTDEGGGGGGDLSALRRSSGGAGGEVRSLLRM